MGSYYVHSLGCRASGADGDAVAAALERDGLRPAALAEADGLVLNTCAVTAEAERTARAWVRRAGRTNPGARIVVTGCYAQRAPGELAALHGVHAVVGNSHKALVPTVASGNFVPVGALHRPFTSIAHAAFAAEHDLPLLAPGGTRRTRPVLKAQDGCGNRCAFCVIPETRGPSRSVPLDRAVAAARAFAEGGGQELVLSGINLGRWGRDLRPARTLAELVRALLEQTALPRLRLSSVEPMDWTPELLGLFAAYAGGEHPRLAPHAHLPLQSGADATLRAMHRRYRPWHYAEKLGALRRMLPDAALGADVMVGFPGETEALFQESLAFVEAMPLNYLHIFPFSARPGTPAFGLPPVPPAAARERAAAMDALASAKKEAFLRRFLGRTLSAITLSDGTAMTANFLSVRLQTPAAANRLVRVRMASIAESRFQAFVEDGMLRAGA